jgi:hypothetical protein
MNYSYEIKNFKTVIEIQKNTKNDSCHSIFWTVGDIFFKNPPRSGYYRSSFNRTKKWLEQNNPELLL